MYACLLRVNTRCTTLHPILLLRRGIGEGDRRGKGDSCVLGSYDDEGGGE